MSTAESVGEPVYEHARSSFADVFGDALRGHPCSVRGVFGAEGLLPVHEWVRPATSSDRALLDHCRGLTLDVGCGPGRMGAHLRKRGNQVLAVDIVGEAVHQARRRGVAAVHRSVFDPLPGEGAWDTVLLADGNIGIGGEPLTLLRRAAELLAADGRVVADLAPPGSGVSVHAAHLSSRGRRTPAFPWAQVGADAIEPLATGSGLGVVRVQHHHGRWFAVLAA